MPITFKCSVCGTAEDRPDYMSGMTTKCKNCCELGRVPGDPVDPPKDRAEFECPFCHATEPPSVGKRVTVAGVLCGVLLFPIGLILTVLLQEKFRRCSSCNIKLD